MITWHIIKGFIFLIVFINTVSIIHLKEFAFDFSYVFYTGIYCQLRNEMPLCSRKYKIYCQGEEKERIKEQLCMPGIQQ